MITEIDQTASIALPINSLLAARVEIIGGSRGLILAESTTQEEACEILRYFAQLHEHSGFMLGDLINQLEARHGEKYKDIAETTGFKASTLQKCAYVARQIPFELRKADKRLTYSHCIELAKLSDVGKIEAAVKGMAEAPEGDFPSVKETRARVEEIINPTLPGIPIEPQVFRDITPAERVLLNDLQDKIDALEFLLTGEERLSLDAFLHQVDNKYRSRLGEKLPVIVEFAGLLEGGR